MKTVLVISLIIYPLFFNLLGGAGLAAGAYNNYESAVIGQSSYHHFLVLGIMMILSSVIMTSATVLCFCKKNIPAVITETVGTLLCILVVLVLIKTASENGLSNEALKPYRDIYAERHLPTVIHTVALITLCLVQKFSGRDESSY